jgi:hypothetical protein
MNASESTNRQYSTQDLLEAGASQLFADYYELAGENASARREVEKGPFSLDKLSQNPDIGGGFFAALWEGDTVQAIRRADSQNARILESVTGMTRADTF